MVPKLGADHYQAAVLIKDGSIWILDTAKIAAANE
jgi:hypothetical protein